MCEGTISSGESRLQQCIRIANRALLRARDLYVKSLGGCAGRAERRPTFMYAMRREQSRSFQCQSSGLGGENDINDLIREASRSRLRSMPIKASDASVRRTQSVATMRIDEERACEFEEPDDVRAVAPRNQSVVVSERKVGISFRGLDRETFVINY